MNSFMIGKRAIGGNASVFIIAEGCDNHFGDLGAAKEMARLAKLAGCDCIKFQHHLPDEEMLPDVPMSSNFDIPLYDFLKRYSLSLQQHIEIKRYCEDIGIIYLCTPFSLKAARELNDIGVEAFKIGSGEMTDIPTLLRIAEMGKPMIISTGMSTLDEIKRTHRALSGSIAPLAFTNCVSEYPPKYEDINLLVLLDLQQQFSDVVIGHSDHTPELYTSFAAVALGAKIVEKHVTLSKTTPGPDQSVSIDFNDLHNLVDGIRKIELSMGSNKIVHPSEESIRTWAFRSIVSVRKIISGHVITQEDLWSKRPGTGIPSYKMDEIIGKKASHDIPSNTLLTWEDFTD